MPGFRRLSRTLPLLEPDQTGTGAVPVKRAKASFVAEPAHSRCLADDQRGRQHPSQERRAARGEPAEQVAQLVLQRGDLPVQLLAPLEELPGEAGDDAVEPVEPGKQLGDQGLTAKTAGGDLQVRIELVEEPADLAADPVRCITRSRR